MRLTTLDYVVLIVAKFRPAVRNQRFKVGDELGDRLIAGRPDSVGQSDFECPQDCQ